MKLTTGLLAAVSSIALTAMPATAQSGRVQDQQVAPPAEAIPGPNPVGAAPAAGGEIIVTAQRREQALTDIPISITAIGGETLQNRNIADTSDLAKLVPGLAVAETTFATPVYTLRGVGNNEASLGAASSVAIYTDEVPLPYPVMTLGSTLDTERIEVLKGPQGTLYGQNSTGGAINYITNKPTPSFSAGADLSYGRFNTVSAEGFVSGPIASTLGARLAVRGIRGDGWQRSITRDDSLGEVRRFAGRALLQWDPSEDFSALLNVNGFIDESDNPAAQLIEVIPSARLVDLFPHLLTSPLPGNNARDADWDAGSNFERDDKFHQIALSMRWQLNDMLSLTSITGHSKYQRSGFLDPDGTAFQIISYTVDGSIETLSQELRLAAEFSGIRWLVGANLNRDTIADDQVQFFPDNPNSIALGVPGFTQFGVDADQKVRSWAVFTNVDVPLLDTLTLTGGIRYSYDRRSFVVCSKDSGNGEASQVYTRFINSQRAGRGLPPIAAIPAGGCVSTDANLVPGLFRDTLTERNVPWNVNLSWEPSPDALIYGLISKGFKSGNYPALPAVSQGSYFPVVQEELLAYEVGTKVALSRALRIEAALFHYDYTDKQLRGRTSLPVFGTVQSQVNVPKSRIRGAEVSAFLRPMRDFSVTASGTYLGAKIKEFVGFDFLGVLVDQSGERLNFTPKYSANLDVAYSRPLTTGLQGFFGANLAYRSKSVAEIAAPEVFEIKPYTLLDAQLGLEDPEGNWRAWVWGKNITNEYYWTNVRQPSQTRVRNPGMPATYGVSLSFRY